MKSLLVSCPEHITACARLVIERIATWERRRARDIKVSIFQFAGEPQTFATYRLVWLMTSFNFSWSVDGSWSYLFRPSIGRLVQSCCVLSDVSGSLLTGDCDCWRCSKCGYCCLNELLKFMKAEIDGEPSRVAFCVRQKWNHKSFEAKAAPRLFNENISAAAALELTHKAEWNLQCARVTKPDRWSQSTVGVYGSLAVEMRWVHS